MADSENRGSVITEGEEMEKSTPQTSPADVSELNKQNKKQLMLLKKLKLKYDDVENKNKLLEASLLAKENAFAELKLAFDNLKIEKSDASNKIALVELENSKLVKQVKDLSEQLDCMALKQETVNETFKCLQDEIKTVQSRNMDLEKQIFLLNDARDNALQSLKLTKEELRVKEEELHKEASLAHQEKLEIVKKFEDLSNYSQQLQLKLADVEEKNTVMNTNCQDLQEQCLMLNEMQETYKAQVDKLEKSLLECQEMSQRFTAKNEELKLLLEHSEFKRKEFEDMLSKNQNEHHSVDSEMKTEIDHLTNSLQSSQNKYLELEEQLRGIMDENARLIQKVQDVETTATLLEPEKCKELEEQLRCIMNENASLTQRAQDAETTATLFEQEKWKELSSVQEEFKDQIYNLEKSLFECKEIIQSITAEKETLKLNLEHSENLRHELEELCKDHTEEQSVISDMKCELDKLKSSLECFQCRNLELEEQYKCISTENHCLQQKVQEVEAKGVLLQHNYDELCSEKQNLGIEHEKLQETLYHLNNQLADLEKLKLIENENETIKRQLEEFTLNQLSLKDTVDAQRIILEDIYHIIPSLNNESGTTAAVNRNFKVEDIVPALKQYFTLENVKLLEDKFVNTDLDSNYDNCEHDATITALKEENTRAVSTLCVLEDLLQKLDSRVTAFESNNNGATAHTCYSKQVETKDASTEIEDGVVNEETNIVDRNADNLGSNKHEVLDKVDRSTEIANGELLTTDVHGRVENDCCECSCHSSSLVIQELADKNEERRRLLEMTLSSADRLKCHRKIIENSMINVLKGFQELNYDDETGDYKNGLEHVKLQLDEIIASSAECAESDISNELNHLDGVLTILVHFEKSALQALRTWNAAFTNASLREDKQSVGCLTLEELQKNNEMQEKKIKEIEALVNKYKIVAVKAKKETAELKKKLSDADSEIASVINARDSLSSEIERITTQLTLLDQEKASNINLNKTLEQQLNQEKEKHKITLSKLDQALKEVSQSNVISLEIADYDRLLRDLNKQMEAKNAEVSKLQTELQFQKEMIQSYVIQIEQLESQSIQNEARIEQLKEASKKLKLEIAELREAEQQWKKSESVMNAQLETANCEVENYKLQVADILSTNQKLQELGRVTEEAHNRVLRAHETKMNALMDELQDMKDKYTLCQTEYENYKIRVHSVLKHKKSSTSDGIPANQGTHSVGLDSEEKCRLEKTVEALQTKVRELMAQLSAAQSELHSVEQEHESLLQRHNRVVLNLNEQEASWKQRVERLQKELLAEQREHSDTVRQMQQHQQLTMSSSVKQQIDALHLEHKQQLEELQDKLSESYDEATRLRQELAEAKANLNNINREDDVSLDILNTERQDGEGSEFTDPILGTPKHMSGSSGFVPLEQLLSQDSRSDTNTDAIEIEKLENQLAGATKKIDHLTEILHESEATNARMTEQTRVLKEEIRRLERNQEREKHFANMEYVKNVILKFFTLPAGDERERLVPVLTTVLRLSPDEEQKVHGIAKVGSESQGQSGWGSYLPLPRWPGSH